MNWIEICYQGFRMRDGKISENLCEEEEVTGMNCFLGSEFQERGILRKSFGSALRLIATKVKRGYVP